MSEEDIDILEDDAHSSHKSLAERLMQDPEFTPDPFNLVNNGKPKIIKKSSGKAKVSEKTKAALGETSRRAKWTAEERALFSTGLEIYGKSWNNIAELVHTKTADEVKQYAQKYFKIQRREARVSVRLAREYEKKAKRDCDINWVNSHVQVIEDAQHDSDIDVIVDSVSESSSLREDSSEQLSSPTRSATHSVFNSHPVNESLNVRTDNIAQSNLYSPPISEENKESIFYSLDPIYEDIQQIDVITSHDTIQESSKNFSNGQLSYFKEDYGVLNSNRDFIPLPAPQSELQIRDDEISEIEKTVHFEFFQNRNNKTAERYRKIRNYILEQWRKQRPRYLNKTSVRSGLKQCGDVNCIGRIHALLEQLGAINFNCEEAVYKRIHTNKKLQRNFKDESTQPQINKQRKRRTKENVEGVTTEHVDEETPPTVKHYKTNSRSSSSLLDPFKLIPCKNFTDCYQGRPFEVVLDAQSLSIMDVHAHMCKTEVIGMLGGLYDSENKILTVRKAEPCSSSSSTLHCDMDPVSQTRAGQMIEDAGLNVVGWYHSHPTFEPDPSMQDVESQEKFQQWFTREGGQFVGIIINPYNMYNPQNTSSEIRCFTLASKRNGDGSEGNRVPFKFDHRIESKSPAEDLQTILLKVKRLLDMYEDYEHCVDMLDSYHSESELTALEKLILSLETYFKITDSTSISYNMLLGDIKYVIESFYAETNQSQ